MTFLIESGIPLPPPQRPTGRPPGVRNYYSWRDMNIGDSFLVPGGTKDYVGRSARAARDRLGYEFALRYVEGGVRVWRVE